MTHIRGFGSTAVMAPMPTTPWPHAALPCRGRSPSITGIGGSEAESPTVCIRSTPGAKSHRRHQGRRRYVKGHPKGDATYRLGNQAASPGSHDSNKTSLSESIRETRRIMMPPTPTLSVSSSIERQSFPCSGIARIMHDSSHERTSRTDEPREASGHTPLRIG